MADDQPILGGALPLLHKKSDEARRNMSIAAKARCTPEWRAAMSKAYSTPIDEAKLRELYESGMTQTEVAGVLGVSQKVVWKAMRRLGIKSRPAVPRESQRAEGNHNWKGSAASYTANHTRVYKARGKPSHCEMCGTSDASKLYEWANLTGQYHDVNDYKRMCRECHRKFDDERRGGAPGKRTDITADVVELLRGQGLSINEIAKLLGTSWPTIKSRMAERIIARE